MTNRPAFPRLRRIAATLPVAGLTVWLFHLTSAALAPYQTWFQLALALVVGLWFLSHGLFFLFDGALFLLLGTGGLSLHRLA